MPGLASEAIGRGAISKQMATLGQRLALERLPCRLCEVHGLIRSLSAMPTALVPLPAGWVYAASDVDHTPEQNLLAALDVRQDRGGEEAAAAFLRHINGMGCPTCNPVLNAIRACKVVGDLNMHTPSPCAHARCASTSRAECGAHVCVCVPSECWLKRRCLTSSRIEAPWVQRAGATAQSASAAAMGRWQTQNRTSQMLHGAPEAVRLLIKGASKPMATAAVSSAGICIGLPHQKTHGGT